MEQLNKYEVLEQLDKLHVIFITFVIFISDRIIDYFFGLKYYI